jgi:hypothetical protein
MVDHLLNGVLLPALVAAAILCAGWRPWRKRDRVRTGHWSAAIAMAVAGAMSFVSRAWPLWTDPDAGPTHSLAEAVRGSMILLTPSARIDRIVLLILATGGIGLAASLVKRPAARAIGTAGLLALAMGLIIRPPDHPAFTTFGVLGLCATAVTLWAMTEPLAALRAGASLPLSFLVLLGGVSWFMAINDLLMLALVCAAIGASAGMAAIVAGLNPTFSLARGGTPVLIATLAVTMWLGAWYHQGDAPRIAFVLPLAGPALLWFGELPLVARRRPWVGLLVRPALAGIPVAIALGLAMKGQPTGS